MGLSGPVSDPHSPVGHSEVRVWDQTDHRRRAGPLNRYSYTDLRSKAADQICPRATQREKSYCFPF